MPDEVYQRQCQRMGCPNRIDPKRKTVKFCSDACRQADGREMRKLRPQVLCCECQKKIGKKGIVYVAAGTAVPEKEG